MGYGNTSGSVAGGGVLREVETVVMPPNQSEVTIEPKTSEPVVVVPATPAPTGPTLQIAPAPAAPATQLPPAR
jgi:hypothetical protein